MITSALCSFLSLWLVTQLPVAEPSTPTPAPEVTTNEGETFKDPFSNPPSEVANPNSVPVPSTSEPMPGEPVEAVEPASAPAATPPPLPRKEFQFPGVEPEDGPVSQDVIQARDSQRGSVIGGFSLAVLGGGAFNFNKRPNQAHFELDGAYRYSNKWEFGADFSYRYMSDKIIGMIGTATYMMRLTKPPSNRIDLGLKGGLGWSLRSKKSKFTEGRLTVKAVAEGLFYVSPSFALMAATGVDGFLFSLTSDGDTTNLLKDNGPPVQTLALIGARLEF